MLEEQRIKIDAIDLKLVQLFEERMHVVEEVIDIKLKNNMEILDSSREEQVIQKAVNRLDDAQLSDELRDFFTELMRISRGYQARIKSAKK